MKTAYKKLSALFKGSSPPKDIHYQYLPELNLYKISTPKGKYFVNVNYDHWNMFYSRCPVFVYTNYNIYVGYGQQTHCIRHYGGEPMRVLVVRNHRRGLHEKAGLFIYQLIRNRELTIQTEQKEWTVTYIR